LFVAGLLVKAEGLAILTVVKVGFLVTARGGSGIVIARLGNRSESLIKMFDHVVMRA
jgi:lipid-binding SYLF domain-containing protein